MRPWLLLVLVGVAATADARFADTQGFSGKHNVTCVACHLPDDAPFEAAAVSLTGLPGTWELATSYPLTITVTGGPPANPAPDTPQAGFDLEIDQGTLAEGDGMEGLLRFPTPQEATYTGIGTFVRSWNIVWTSPDLSREPTLATFWVGALASNGNHVMDGPDTAGERGDRMATLVATSAPSEAALKAWNEQPLPAPSLEPFTPEGGGAAATLSGSVADFADGAEVRIDDEEWMGAIGAPFFFYSVPGLSPGGHTIDARAVWRDRASEPTRIEFTVPGEAPAANGVAVASDDRTSSAVYAWLLILLLVPVAPFLLKIRR